MESQNSYYSITNVYTLQKIVKSAQEKAPLVHYAGGNQKSLDISKSLAKSSEKVCQPHMIKKSDLLVTYDLKIYKIFCHFKWRQCAGCNWNNIQRRISAASNSPLQGQSKPPAEPVVMISN